MVKFSEIGDFCQYFLSISINFDVSRRLLPKYLNTINPDFLLYVMENVSIARYLILWRYGEWQII